MYKMTMEGVRAPELVGDERDWLNSPAIRLRDLRDKVVLLDFWDYTCVNCLRTLPYVKAWHERYSDLGLVVIGVHTPEFEFAKSRRNVSAAVRDLGIAYPVLLDSNYANWENFANRYWPRKFLVDPDRRIVHDRIGEGAYGETEAAIQRQIHRLAPGATMPEPVAPVRPEDVPGTICYPTTPETYAGFRRGTIGNPEGYAPYAAFAYSDPGKRQDGVIYLRGTWRATPEGLIHARETTEPEDYLALRYHALEVNAVIKPERDVEVDVLVLQDGKPLRKEDAGKDIRLTEDGEAYVRVTEPRMYHLVRNERFGSHEIRLHTASDAFGLYAFTFGSCEEPD